MPERECDFLPIAVFREFEKRINDALKHNSEVMSIIHAASKEAISKSEDAHSKRFDSLNEFNQRMRELSQTFLPRETYDAAHNAIENRIRVLESSRNVTVGRSSLSDPLLMALVASAGGFLLFIFQMLFKK